MTPLCWTQDPITVATIVIAGATVVNVFVSLFLWRATHNSAEIARQVFEAANRPYLGPENIRPTRDDLSRTLRLVATIKNFGTATAEDALLVWTAYLDGIEATLPGFPDKPTAIFPGQSAEKLALFFGPTYDSIVTGKAELILKIQLRYKGPAHSYAYCEKFRFVPPLNSCVHLGQCN